MENPCLDCDTKSDMRDCIEEKNECRLFIIYQNYLKNEKEGIK